jgi:hypothetical protein
MTTTSFSVKEKLVERLCRLASLSPNDCALGTISDEFRDIAGAYVSIATGKQTHYGDYVGNLANDPEQLQIIQLYCEVKRKWVRFDNMIKRIASGDKSVKHDELIVVMADLGVYSILAIQLFLAQERARKQ